MTVNKQTYVHAAYHVAEMAILSIMNTHFFYRYLRWFDLANTWSYRLFEAWLVNHWFKVDLVGDV